MGAAALNGAHHARESKENTPPGRGGWDLSAQGNIQGITVKRNSQLDTVGNGYITFKDCFRSKEVIDELREEWRKIDKKERGQITLADLPDLTP